MPSCAWLHNTYAFVLDLLLCLAYVGNVHLEWNLFAVFKRVLFTRVHCCFVSSGWVSSVLHSPMHVLAVQYEIHMSVGS